MLIEEYRGELLENIHDGRICVVDETGRIIGDTGGADTLTYYRSAAKPFQLIPLLIRGLDKKYGLTDSEITICAASHTGEEMHIAALESIMKKADLKESDLIMLPTYPINAENHFRLQKEGLPQRRLYHNCSGKHLALMMLARELSNDVTDYWRPESKTQQEVIKAVAAVSEYPAKDIKIGIDGCGVPVFGVPLKCIASAYMKLANPAAVKDSQISAALAVIAHSIAKNPYLIRGHGYLCGEINSHPNFVAKCGAEGVYCIGMKNERIGIALKSADGSEHALPIVVAEILRQLGYKDDAMYATLEKLKNPIKYNDNADAIGEYRPVFKLR